MAYKSTLKYSNNRISSLPKLPGMPSMPGLPSMPSMPSLPNMPGLSNMSGMNININILPNTRSYKHTTTKGTSTQNTSTQDTLLSNYNDPLEINSLRDVIFGSSNRYMKHALPFQKYISDKIPELNIVADSLQHAWQHYLQPLVMGNANYTILNTLMGLGEDMDILANPVKSVIISAWNGDDISQALVRSTFGDETGIHNYDYDTGNKLLDIVLEIVSDPIFITEAVSGIAAPIKGAKEASKIGSEFAQSNTKIGTKRTVKKISKELGTEVNEKALKEVTAETIQKTNLAKITKNGQLWKKFVQGDKQTRKELIKKLFKNNSWDDVAEAYNANFTQVFAKNLAQRTGQNEFDIFLKLSNSKAFDVVLDTVDDVMKGAYNTMSSTIITSLFNRVQFIDDAYTSTVWKLGFSTTGVYPLYRVFKSDAVQEFLHLQTLRKVQQGAINRTLTAQDTFLKQGHYKGTNQIIDQDMTIRAIYMDTSKHIGPQEGYDLVATRLADYANTSRKLLGFTNETIDVRERAILNVLQSIDSYHKINSIDDFIDILQELKKAATDYNGDKYIITGFEQYIDEFTELNKIIKNVKDTPNIMNKLNKMAPNITLSKQFDYMAKQLNLFETYGFEDVLNTAKYYETDNLLQLFSENNAGYYFRAYQNIINDKATAEQINTFMTEGVPYLQRVYSAFSTISSIYQDKDLEYITKNLGKILNDVEQLKPSLTNNFKNILNKITALENKLPTQFDKNIFDETSFKVLFQQSRSAKVNLVKTLQDNINFKPTKDLKYKDTPLAKWMKNVNIQSNKLINKLERNNNLVKAFEQEQAINIYSKNVAARVENLTKNFKDNVEHQIQASYNLSTMKDLCKETSNDILNIFLKYDTSLSNIKINLLDNPDNRLPEKIAVHFTNVIDGLDSLYNTLNQITNADVPSEAVYYNIYKTYQDIMYEYKFIKNLEEYKNIFQKQNPDLRPITDAIVDTTPINQLSEIIETISNKLDFNLIDKEINTVQANVDLIYLKLENAAVQAHLNNNTYLKELMRDPKFGPLITNAINLTNPNNKYIQKFYSGFNDESKRLFKTLAGAVEGVNNTNRLFKDIDHLVSTLPADLRPTYVDLTIALWSTIQNLKNVDIDKINRNNLLKKWVYSIQGYINGNDYLMRKKDMDTLIRETGIEDELLKELKASGFTDIQRHFALYDTAAQIKVWEAQHPGEVFQGYMLDIETTGLVDPTGFANGNITDITILARDPMDNTKFKIIYDGKIQLPENKLNVGNKPLPSVLNNMGISDKVWIDYHKAINKEVTEKDILQEFWTQLNNIATNDPQARVMTFNGDDFDWVFLDTKLEEYGITEALTKFDKKRKVRGLTFTNELLRVSPSLEQLLDRLSVEDYYKELSKDRYVVDSQFVLKLKNLMDRQFARQEKLKPLTNELGYNPTFISGIDDNFMSALNGFLKLDELRRITPESGLLKDFNSFDLFNMAVEGNSKIDGFMQITESTKRLQQTKALKYIFEEDLDPELQKILIDLRNSIYSDLKDIGSINRAFSSIPIPSNLFDANSPLFNEALLKNVQKDIADTLIKFGADPASDAIQQLLNGQLNNMSQLATIGLKDDLILGYRKVSGNRLLTLDLTDVVTDRPTNIKLDNFIRQVERVDNAIINDTVLIDQQNNIKSMIKDIKDSKIILEAQVLPLDQSDLYYNYALLETVYRKIENVANSNSFTKEPADKLIKELKEKYPELSTILHSRVPSIKISLNDNLAKVQLPAYLDSKYMDYGQLLGFKDVNTRALNKIQALDGTAEYHLKSIKKLETVGAGWLNLWQMRYDTFDLNGLPTRQTVHYQNLGKEYTKILFAKETQGILNLSPLELRNYIIYANRSHILTINRPSSKYFGNRDLFAMLATKADALKELGVTWKYDKELEQLTLGIDTDIIKLGINKNYNKTLYYTIDGIPIEKVTLPELTYQELQELMPNGGNYLKQMHTVRQRLVQMNPDLSGHPGLVNVKEQYINVMNDPIIPTFKNSKILNGDEYMPYFKMDYVGDLDTVMELSGYFSTDYFDMLASLTNKHINHSHQHIEFGQFIMQGGLKLNSKELKNMSSKELIDMLHNRPDLVVVYLADNEKSLGGFELKRINNYTPKILKEAQELNATIVPYNIYAQAANAINQYTYGSYTSALWHKIITMYKQSFLLTPGVLLRNAIDSTMKTFAEGNTVSGTMKAYTQAFDLLNKYDTVLREIRQLDPLGKYRLEVAEEYFNKPNVLLDKEVFHFIYDFMEDSGMNTISTQLNGMFNVAMKPMSWIERVSRFAMYLNLQNQGEAYSEIIRRIAQTHFDYGLKSYGQFIAENYIPFVTFVTNNIMYVLHLVEENPAFLKNFMNFYQPIWDFDSLNYEELAANSSLQYQILNGNLPLNMFGYQDKEIERTVQTRYGPRKQKVTNTAVLRIGSSILDGISFFLSPINNIQEKLAPPFQLISDDITNFTKVALGNSSRFKYKTYQETLTEYSDAFGNMAISSLFKDPSSLLGLLPYTNAIQQRYMHYNYDTDKYEFGSTTGVRTQNDILGSLPSIFGATSRWGEFIKTPTNNYKKYNYLGSRYKKYSSPKTYTPKSSKTYIRKPRKIYARKSYPRKGFTIYPQPSRSMYNSYIYYPKSQAFHKIYATGKTPYNNYSKFIYRAAYPNKAHNFSASYRSNLPKLQSIPQYLHSYNGLTRTGKSKLLSWMNMNTRFKVKTTLKRQARARSLYSKV